MNGKAYQKHDYVAAAIFSFTTAVWLAFELLNLKNNYKCNGSEGFLLK